MLLGSRRSAATIAYTGVSVKIFEGLNHASCEEVI